MNRIAIVTDSSTALPKDLAEALNIHVVPVLITYNGQTFRDGVDIAPSELYKLLRQNEHLPTTASPSAGDFLRVYATLAKEYDGIVSIHFSPRLSATYDTAMLASRLLDHVTIRVLDCGTAAMGQGFVAMEAARVAAAGADLAEVVARATEVGSKANVLAALGTLEYLYRGGRIGRAAALMGSLLQIKPVLYIGEGQVEVFAKTRTMGRAKQLILQRMAQVANGRRLHAAIMHADMPDKAEEFRQEVAERFDCAELFISEFTPVMGAHTGPGVLGVAFFAE